MKTKRKKCTDTHYCSTLDERIGYQSDPGYGFSVGSLVSVGSRKIRTTPVFYRVPKKRAIRRDGGGDMHMLYLNFCPFCGYSFETKLEAFRKQLESDAA